MAESEREQIQNVLRHPIDFPQEFKDWVSDYLALNMPKITVSQVYGFRVESYKEAKVTTEESTSSTSYTDLTTTGPKISNLVDGLYLVIVGFLPRHTGAQTDAFMSFSPDGASAVDSDAASANHPGSAMKVSLVDFRNPVPVHQHTLQAKYRVASNTHFFARRFIIALKVIEDAN